MPQPIIGLSEFNGVTTADGASSEYMVESLKNDQIVLPYQHLELLSQSNGVMVFFGYIRLFGAGSPDLTDLVRWNARETWKFAWSEQVLDFVCFGETTWGDQYAYHKGELSARGDPQVYQLDALSMNPQIISSSFAEFFKTDFLENAKKPFDEMTCQAKEKLGPLNWSDHVVYLPSLLLDGDAKIENVEKMDARVSMIINGDLARQCGPENQGRTVGRLDDYLDDKGRTRLKIIWD